SAMRTIGGVHWESPIVADGRVYCPDENGRLTAYELR
ncbi:MAG: PQQ-binding-like beta-propeller repeat protein, partial [Candidatus Eremiobacteraeota bacterium]|nr:PQQ-binding-like beta-propeller repeat protein [Candidatus Eremiobacteraeota bacterium]